MRSTEVIIMRLRQQYLDTWSSSRTLPGSSPAPDVGLELRELVSYELPAGEAAYGY